MHFRLGVNPQHVTEWKKGRSNPSGETTLAMLGIAEERAEGATGSVGSTRAKSSTPTSASNFALQRDRVR
jgi:hypothetical protein